ncbi:hypothetical protein ABT075_18100 [Streptomyces sp. NPDC002677]|uniref:hypothetical protein n=1 Tax=Streptomyces sp. NPDC002677 TaxID=3154774 RepID=UPI003329C02B
MSASPAVRSLRAAVFAAVCVLLAAAGHGLAMGDMPPLWADAAGFVAVFGLGRALAGQERGLPEIVAGMLLTQAGLHVGFDAARAATPAPSRTMGMGHMGMGHVGMGHMGMAHMGMAHMSPGQLRMHGHAMAGMVHHPHALTAHATAAHVLAALVASWWLRCGEAALWSLSRRAAALVPGLAAWWCDAPLPAPAAGPHQVPADPIRPRRLLALRHAVSRRGPPSAIPYPV